MNPELEASYRWCREICKQSKSSFFASFRLLDPPRRRAMYALYAFSRISDDLSDDTALSVDVGKGKQEQRGTVLAAWRDRTSELVASGAGSNDDGAGRDSALSDVSTEQRRDGLAAYAPLWPALQDAVTRYEIPIGLLEAIVDGVTMDIDHQPFNDWPELENYCYHVASAVGLACVYIWRRRGETAQAALGETPTAAAVDCGTAFQITNILRDVAEDARAGRIYVPKSMLDQYQVDSALWLAGSPDGQWESLMDDLANRAIKLYDRGWPTIEHLTPSSQKMFSLIWRSYRSLLDEVISHKADVWSDVRIRLPVRRRMRLLTTHFVPPLYRRLESP